MDGTVTYPPVPRDIALHLSPSAAPPALDDDEALVRAAVAQLRIPAASLAEVRVTKISFDARPGLSRGYDAGVPVFGTRCYVADRHPLDKAYVPAV